MNRPRNPFVLRVNDDYYFLKRKWKSAVRAYYKSFYYYNKNIESSNNKSENNENKKIISLFSRRISGLFDKYPVTHFINFRNYFSVYRYLYHFYYLNNVRNNNRMDKHLNFVNNKAYHKYKSFFLFSSFDKRNLIFSSFFRILMCQSNMYSVYGNNMLIFSVKFDNLHTKLDTHGSYFLTSILYKPISFLFRL